MANFMARIELHDEKSNDYPKLHAEMQARGFARMVLINGVNHHLPHAEYMHLGGEDNQSIYTKAKASVDAIGRKAGIVITKAAGSILVDGLKPA